MNKILVAALTASVLAMPVVAQTVDIDDDGWTFVEAKAAPAMTVDIDDDGWTAVSVPLVRSDRGAATTDGTCTTLERSAGLSGDACGTVSLSALTKMMGSGN